jgi:hypothetical protein
MGVLAHSATVYSNVGQSASVHILDEAKGKAALLIIYLLSMHYAC